MGAYRNWCCFLLSLVGTGDYGLPSTRTLALALISSVLSLLLGTVFAVHKTEPNVLIFVSSILAVAVAFLCFADWLKRRRAYAKGLVALPVYARNLGNTVTTSIITLLAVPLLYQYVWYPGLDQDVTTFEKDTVVCLSSTLVFTNGAITYTPLAIGPCVFTFDYPLST